MAQHTEPPQIVVPISEDIKYASHLQQRNLHQTIESPERKDLRVPFQGSPSRACSPEITRRHRDLSNLNKGLECGRGEETMERSSPTPVQRNSKMFVKGLKARLQDPRWGYDKMDREDDDWFLDEDFLEGVYPKKKSLLTDFQLASLVIVMMILACTLSVAKLKNCKLWDLPIWKWEVVVAVMISGHLVSGGGVRIVVFSMERTFLTKIRVLYLVYGTKKAVQHCIWLALIVTAWHYLVVEKMAKETHSKVLERTSKVLLCLLVASLVWLVKQIIVKILASSFHDKKFFDRAKTYLFKQYVIKKLSRPPESREESEGEVELRSKVEKRNFPQLLKGVSRKQDTISLNSRKINGRKGSAAKLKRLISLVQSEFLETLSTLDESLPDSSDDEDEKSLSNDAQKVAKKIFHQVAKGSEIVLEDLKKYIRDEQKALYAMHLFKGSAKMGGIDEQAFGRWMVDAFRERRSLLLSLNDTNTAVEELHHLMDVVVAILIVIIWLIIFELKIAHFLVLISSQLLLAVFIFGNTCKTVFEAIVFLFIMHPFDVGDRCEIDEVQMVVEEMNILTTVFERSDNQKIIYPNSVLATKPIGNFHRSIDMGDQVEFSIHISTPREKIDSMKDKIKRYIEENDKHWYREPVIIVKDVEDMNRLKMVVWPRHKMNHQDMLQRWVRRALLIDKMISIFRELDIEYRMLPLDLNVRNMAGTSSDKLPSNWTTSNG